LKLFLVGKFFVGEWSRPARARGLKLIAKKRIYAKNGRAPRGRVD